MSVKQKRKVAGVRQPAASQILHAGAFSYGGKLYGSLPEAREAEFLAKLKAAFPSKESRMREDVFGIYFDQESDAYRLLSDRKSRRNILRFLLENAYD